MISALFYISIGIALAAGIQHLASTNAVAGKVWTWVAAVGASLAAAAAHLFSSGTPTP